MNYSHQYVGWFLDRSTWKTQTDDECMASDSPETWDERNSQCPKQPKNGH
jgi:hypothetical protein